MVTGRKYFPVIFSALLLGGGLAISILDAAFFEEWVKIAWYALAYLPVGTPVVKKAVDELLRLDFANEFFLMSVATIGAFAIGEYAEAVAVMLFYEVGELLQQDAVGRARGNIKALLDLRPDRATVKRGGEWVTVKPGETSVGEVIMVKQGEKVPLDGELLSESTTVNTSAITGESRPDRIYRGDRIHAGSINTDGVAEIRVTRGFADSSLSRILNLVEEASQRKAPTERFMRRFARWYTPLVMSMALLITFLPILIVEGYVFTDWVYRAFVFLVIACPCALYVSIPLGYFGGIGSASRNGILFKGADYLDRMKDLHTLIIDKTGTLTKGNFKVTQVNAFGIDSEELVRLTAALESRSNHPVARAVVEFSGSNHSGLKVEDVTEVPAHGMKARIGGKEVIAGNVKLMARHGVEIPTEAASIPYTCVHVAIDGRYSGYLVIADEVREDSASAVSKLKKMGAREIVVLSGDREGITREVAGSLGIDHAHGDLLPEEKTAIVREYLDRKRGFVAFAGDGINDAPSIALADIGIAMGARGSDLAIETADVVIQTDQPSRIAGAVSISRATNRIVWQNIWMVFIVKALFLGLGAVGVAGMWEAVFADMGVALAAIFNAIRILHKKA